MRQYLAWLWKEWRDQRAITIGILVAIPGLTALAYWAFGEKIGTAHLQNVRPIFLAIAVGLVVFAVAGDLFAGEIRRKTIFAVRRLPGSMRASFCAKLTFLAVLVIVVIALQGLSLAVAEQQNAEQMKSMGISSYHHNGASRSVALYAELAQFPGSTLWMTGLGMGVVALWTLLVSSWMGRSGVAGIGALVLLAALAVPFFFFFKEHPWFFPGPMRLAAITALVAGLVAFGATALSFLRGQRFHGRPFRPFLLGAAVLVVSLGSGYAYARHSLNDWLDLQPTDEDFHIWEARYGAGGKKLFLTVHRGSAWYGDKIAHHHNNGGQDPWSSKRGSPMQAWVVDLETGRHEIVDDRAERFFTRVPEADGVHYPWPMDPVESLVTYRLGYPEGGGLGWWDARTGERMRILPSDVRDSVTLGLVRRQLRSDTWQRDGAGRRAWMRDGVLEHEGQDFEPVPGIVPRNARGPRMSPIPGGWYGYQIDEKGPVGRWWVVDAVDGERFALPKRKNSMPFYARLLSPEQTLMHKFVRGEDGKQRHERYVASLCGPLDPRPVQNMPEEMSSVIGRDLVLALRGEKNARTLHAWNPVTGEDRPFVWKSGKPWTEITSCSAQGRTSDGRILLLIRHERRVHPSVRTGWAVIDPDLVHVRLIRRPRADGVAGLPVALLEDDSLILVQERKRVIRHRPSGTMEVLFPRPEVGP